jgi:integrase
MRRSELVALQWRDLSDAQIVIRRNRVRDGKQFVTYDTKSGTRSHRTINVDPVCQVGVRHLV